MAQHVEVDPGLWEEFHRVVNMPSRELREWLQTHSAGESTEALPDQAGAQTGRRVLQILQKRLRGTLQGNRSIRAEEWRGPEPPADDDPDVPNAGPTTRQP
ncbi:DUF3140 domain-containing protein [Candidatus Mycobacterium methanotrophicum]|uniref:DUF3140 domain-containing protein n=1 Tax=Candidatus Mycobacterium methanotrophicum TaxID=2943498 RepID=A0ABY4QJX0_9MYCO|nr:DUF3140 domain-containing protein [Candidatus Mycobacterium methanotrophicum]UQX10291.1 DUF3140 domain-containing protein [Candidatus Mycobacterium methanotrophicum]